MIYDMIYLTAIG